MPTPYSVFTNKNTQTQVINGAIPKMEQLETEAGIYTKCHMIPKIVLLAIVWTNIF